MTLAVDKLNALCQQWDTQAITSAEFLYRMARIVCAADRRDGKS